MAPAKTRSKSELARAWMVDYAWKETANTAWDWLKDQEYSPEMIEDDDEVRRLYLEQWLGERGYDVYRLNEVELCPPCDCHRMVA